MWPISPERKMAGRDNLEIQIEEMEMIKSIFSQPGEFREDRDSCSAVLAYVKGGYEFSPPPLVYSLNLNIEEVKLEVNITLSITYPFEKPNIYLRVSNSFPGNLNLPELNKEFKEYMLSLEDGEICIYQLVSWLQDNVMQYYTESESANQSDVKDTTLSRYWIYSHHIYSKRKRKDILDLAAKADLTGFILPGSPGIMCLEGYEHDCHDTWIEIKSMNWQKITVKTEEKNCSPPRKFSTFEEKCFEGCSDRRMDMGKFLFFLKQHECEHVFKNYFGCDGQLIENN